MNEIKIEKGVPFGRQQQAASRFPYNKMVVGDSFFVKLNVGETVNAIRVSAYYYGYVLKKKFSTRKEGDGFRVWRIQ
jgi:hypothetical protein